MEREEIEKVMMQKRGKKRHVRGSRGKMRKKICH